VADGVDPIVLRAGRNIPKLKMIPAALLNTLDLIRHRKVIMTVDAVRKAEELWGKVPKGTKRSPKAAVEA
jgi:ribosomal protein L4